MKEQIINKVNEGRERDVPLYTWKTIPDSIKNFWIEWETTPWDVKEYWYNKSKETL